MSDKTLKEAIMFVRTLVNLQSVEARPPRRRRGTMKVDDYEIFFDSELNKCLEKQEVWFYSGEWHIYAMRQSPKIKHW